MTSLHFTSKLPIPILLGWPLPIPGAQHGKQGAIALDLGQCREPGNESLGGVELAMERVKGFLTRKETAGKLNTNPLG